MFPLVRPAGENQRASDYHTLDHALTSGLLEITEVSEQGTVPELRAINRGPLPTLIVDGEELVGAKQNRVVNLTILVPANCTLTIPVSCVEAGRWRARSKGFASAPRTQYSTGRAKRMAQVTESMRTSGRHNSDQSEVWADIAEKMASLKSSSPTGAMSAMFEQHGSFIDKCAAAFQPVEDQVGALFAIDNNIVGFDLFDSPHSLRTLLPKLVRSVAVDALDHTRSRLRKADRSGNGHGHVSSEQFLKAVSDATYGVAAGVGLGVDHRLTAPGITGAALVFGERVVHLSAFALVAGEA